MFLILPARKMRAQGRKPSNSPCWRRTRLPLLLPSRSADPVWSAYLINIFSEDAALPARHAQPLAHRPDGIIYTTMGCDISRCWSSAMAKILYWRTVWRMTQRYPGISLMITLHNMNQHSICSRAINRQVLATGSASATGDCCRQFRGLRDAMRSG